MNCNLMFSIVVPVYRVEKYLDACVESIRNQTYHNLEIILVDDGSPDTCPAMCDAFARIDSRIRVIHKTNGGSNSARKAGAAIAYGDYVCCVDSDDEIALDYIERFAEAAREHHPDIICSGHCIMTGTKKRERLLPNRLGFYSRADMEREIFPQLIQTGNATYFSPTLWAKAFRTSIYQEQQRKLNDSLKIGEDGACTICCVYSAQSMYILPECKYYYRSSDSSMTKSSKAFDWNGPKLIAEHLQKQVDMMQFDFQEQLYRKIVHELFTVVKSQFNRNEAYDVITKDIKVHLQDPVYNQAIRNASFSGFSGKLALFALKYRVFWLIKLFNEMRH